MKEFWAIPLVELLKQLNTGENGLSEKDAKQRKLATKQPKTSSQLGKDIRLIIKQFKNPLVLIMIGAVLLSSALAEFTNSIIIISIICLSGIAGFLQERKADKAVVKLLDRVRTRSTVLRNGNEYEVFKDDTVPGDIILLNAGDIIPGDCRLIESEDLHVNEASLTGESFPQEKEPAHLPFDTPLGKRKNSLFLGTNVVNGTARAVVVATGTGTVFGKMAAGIDKQLNETDFEKGVRKFGYLLVKITLIITLIIVTFNIYLGKPVVDSFLFGLSLALGMTPELLPAIVTITLSAGAKRMADKNVIIKRLRAIPNIGAINVFCVDKTGTLTEGNVTVLSTVDVQGTSSEKVKTFAYLNALFETGFTNPLDEALRRLQVDTEGYSKFDEVPYDFIRKRLSIVVVFNKRHIMITKGAVKNILDVCDRTEWNEKTYPLKEYHTQINKLHETFSAQGSRTIALAYKDVTDDPVINKDDESKMIFLGFIVLADKPKAGIRHSLQSFKKSGITVKLITGDNEKVAKHLSDQIGLDSATVLTGSMISKLSDEALVRKVNEIHVFAETEPHQKERIVRALRKAGKVVGYIGDGINDVAAMKAADVSISVDSAVDVAKETADIVLLNRSLDTLKEGIYEGRKTFTNTMKYIFITSSANFGNMFSMAVASIFLPFLPLLPEQILLTNFITDLPAMTLPKDHVESESIAQPTTWNTSTIKSFMVVFGAESSFFDLITFGILFFFFNARSALFQSGWFVESVVSEILILLIIRTHRPVFKSIPGKKLMALSAISITLAFALPYSAIAGNLGFVALPPWIVATTLVIILVYCISTEITKKYFFRKILKGRPLDTHLNVMFPYIHWKS